MKQWFKVLRVTFAAVSFVAVICAFVMPTWAFCVGWIARCQLLPAIMAGSVSILIALAVSAVLFGRVYCSVLCPLGIAQDVVRFIFGWLLPKRLPRPASRADTMIRLSVALLFAIGAFFGFAGTLEPYGIFGRFVSLGVMKVGEPGILVLSWAMGLFAVVMVLALVRARWWCNTICPVGTLLGLLAKVSVFHVRIDAAKCNKCGLCAARCDKGALHVSADGSLSVDASRCVTCGNCTGVCRAGALNWR